MADSIVRSGDLFKENDGIIYVADSRYDREQEACSWEENVEWTASWGEGMWLLHDERDDESELAGSWPDEEFEENGGYHIDMAEQEKEEA